MSRPTLPNHAVVDAIQSGLAVIYETRRTICKLLDKESETHRVAGLQIAEESGSKMADMITAKFSADALAKAFLEAMQQSLQEDKKE